MFVFYGSWCYIFGICGGMFKGKKKYFLVVEIVVCFVLLMYLYFVLGVSVVGMDILGKVLMSDECKKMMESVNFLML